MSELKLLNCPFCGGKAFVDTHRFWDEKAKDFTVQTYGVKCYDCQTGTWQHYRKEEDAIKQWNTRTPMANIVEKLEEKTEFLKECTKYGNESSEQQEKSYSTMMMYEVADLVDDLIDIVKQEINNGLE